MTAAIAAALTGCSLLPNPIANAVARNQPPPQPGDMLVVVDHDTLATNQADADRNATLLCGRFGLKPERQGERKVGDTHQRDYFRCM